MLEAVLAVSAVSPLLRKCLTTTNIIESSLSGVEGRTGCVTRWRSGEMALWWAGAAALETERNSRKIIGHKGLWMLRAVLDEERSLSEESLIDNGRVAAYTRERVRPTLHYGRDMICTRCTGYAHGA